MTLKDLIQFALIDRHSERCAKAYLKGRITRYTSPFFTSIRRPDSTLTMKRFFQSLEVTSSWIVGSVLLAVVSLLSDVPQPHNLNIITLHRHLGKWMVFMLDGCGFTVRWDGLSTGAYAGEGWKFVKFHHALIPGFHVTVTTAAGSHLGGLFFAAPNTYQQIAIAAYHVITPYLDAVSAQHHLAGLKPSSRQHPSVPKDITHRTYRSLARFRGATSLSMTTERWTRPCGSVCPGVWRIAFGLHDFAVVTWGGVDGLDEYIDEMLAQLGKSRLQFRLGVKCANKKCGNFGSST
ncbi:hypothetical protein DFH09DRAFT_1301002 [Mycena vulgaris]|nr:hypothetical protein DFH09DRAFT_1301002 [Mycena vulgaris]